MGVVAKNENDTLKGSNIFSHILLIYFRMVENPHKEILGEFLIPGKLLLNLFLLLLIHVNPLQMVMGQVRDDGNFFFYYIST